MNCEIRAHYSVQITWLLRVLHVTHSSLFISISLIGKFFVGFSLLCVGGVCVWVTVDWIIGYDLREWVRISFNDCSGVGCCSLVILDDIPLAVPSAKYGMVNGSSSDELGLCRMVSQVCRREEHCYKFIHFWNDDTVDWLSVVTRFGTFSVCGAKFGHMI